MAQLDLPLQVIESSREQPTASAALPLDPTAGMGSNRESKVARGVRTDPPKPQSTNKETQYELQA